MRQAEQSRSEQRAQTNLLGWVGNRLATSILLFNPLIWWTFVQIEAFAEPAIKRPFGQSAALLGGGTASNADISTVDHNPAGIALGRSLSIEGGTAWTKDTIDASEVGIVDSVMADVAAALKFRQTSSAVGPMERRFSLALADNVGDTGVLLGIAGDYKERPRLNDEGLITKEEQAYEFRAGLLYALSDNFRAGVRSTGYFDEQETPEHAVGLAGLIGTHFVANGDLIFVKDSLDKVVGGLGVVFNKYFDLRATYGYLPQTRIGEGAAGLFLLSPKIALYYVASLPNLEGPHIDHQIGARLNMSL